jgi:hypothetical protein
LKAAVAQQFAGSSWQRCRVHFIRDLHGVVAAKHAPAVTAAVKTIFAHTDPTDVAAQWDQVADTLSSSFPKVAAMMDEAKTDVLAFTAYPRTHWQKIWSNNPIERLNKEIKRRADVVEIFPTPQRSYGWPPPWSSRRMTNGKSPAATYPRCPWLSCAKSSPPNTPPPKQRPNRFPNNVKSPSIHHDSLIITREPTPIRSPPPQGALSFHQAHHRLRRTWMRRSPLPPTLVPPTRSSSQ